MQLLEEKVIHLAEARWAESIRNEPAEILPRLMEERGSIRVSGFRLDAVGHSDWDVVAFVGSANAPRAGAGVALGWVGCGGWI